MSADRRPPIEGRNFWVVGASSGIGAALARELVERGASVAISARRMEELEKVSGGEMSTIVLDATDPEGVALAAHQAAEALGSLDTVIWCAGYWKQFDAAAWDREAFARHIEVNVLGLNNLLAAVVPTMVGQGAGHIVGVASVAGYRGIPGSEAYGATKAAQINLLEAMRGSLAQHGIRVTTVCPGFVRTEMTADNTFSMPFLIEPDQAATSIANGLEKRRNEIIFPLPMALLMKAARAVPVGLWSTLTRVRDHSTDNRRSTTPAEFTRR
ncbi:MAG: SDR family NAD(P)-dependent oxidoreductase [Candidatus Nanopelagicales bacterium]